MLAILIDGCRQTGLRQRQAVYYIACLQVVFDVFPQKRVELLWLFAPETGENWYSKRFEARLKDKGLKTDGVNRSRDLTIWAD